MTYQIIALIANIAIALSFIVALVFGISQVKTTARDRKERFTLQALHNFQSHEFAELMIRINLYDIPATLDEWRKIPLNDQILFLQFSQEMESLGLLVAEELINIDFVDKTLGSFVTTSWDKYKTVVLDMRQKMPDPFLNEYFQWLAERLKERMQTNPRKPFHERKS